MIIHQDIDGSLLAAVSAAPRALVFLTVWWSTPERNARMAFRAAVERLATEHARLGIEFFSLEEEAEWCQRWLSNLKLPQLGGGFPLGVGSMLWLEDGQPISYEVGGAALKAGGIVARSLWLWGGSESKTVGDTPRN